MMLLMKPIFIFSLFTALITSAIAQSEVPTTPYQVMGLLGYEDAGIEEGAIEECRNVSILCMAYVDSSLTLIQNTLGFEDSAWIVSVDDQGKSTHTMVNENVTVVLTEFSNINFLVMAISNVE
jgi:hypothetical protein